MPIAAEPQPAGHIIKPDATRPVRIEADGAARILLITSRETRRWIIPKGNPIRGLEAHQAAAREAFEEAGISGIACPAAIGQYTYEKRKRKGNRHLLVDVYPLAVIRQFDDWPEREQRKARLFWSNDAANLVNEPEQIGKKSSRESG